MLRSLVKSAGAFVFGGATTLLVEQHAFDKGAPMIVLCAAMVFGAALLIFGYWPNVRDWWWLRRQPRLVFDLRVLGLTGLHSFLACHPNDERSRVSVTWRMGNKNKFGVKPGEHVRVTGKMSRRMSDNLNELVECDVLVLRNTGGFVPPGPLAESSDEQPQ